MYKNHKEGAAYVIVPGPGREADGMLWLGGSAVKNAVFISPGGWYNSMGGF